jgi:hypothetical protein
MPPQPGDQRDRVSDRGQPSDQESSEGVHGLFEIRQMDQFRDDDVGEVPQEHHHPQGDSSGAARLLDRYRLSSLHDPHCAPSFVSVFYPKGARRVTTCSGPRAGEAG